MEWLIFIIVIFVIGYVYDLVTKDSTVTTNKTQKKANITPLNSDSIARYATATKFTDNTDSKIFTKLNHEKSDTPKENITNNYYTQNTVNIKNIYVRQNYNQTNNYFSTTKIAQENGLTGPKLFSKLINKGYVYKDGRKHLLTSKGKSAGGSYSYTDSGDKYIVWPADIVSKVTKASTNRVKYSEYGLTKKLFRQTKSAWLTESILVDEYGISEYNAKKLVDRVSY